MATTRTRTRELHDQPKITESRPQPGIGQKSWSKRSTYSNNLTMEGPNELTVIPVEQIEKVLGVNFQPGRPRRLNRMNGS